MITDTPSSEIVTSASASLPSSSEASFSSGTSASASDSSATASSSAPLSSASASSDSPGAAASPSAPVSLFGLIPSTGTLTSPSIRNVISNSSVSYFSSALTGTLTFSMPYPTAISEKLSISKVVLLSSTALPSSISVPSSAKWMTVIGIPSASPFSSRNCMVMVTGLSGSISRPSAP